LRQFSAGWIVCFGLLAARQYFRGHHEAAIALGVVGVVFGVSGLGRPGVMRWIFVSWMMLAFPIGWVLSQIMLLLMFYVILTPVAVLVRIGGRDVLRRRRSNCESYWVVKETPKDVRSYFRQY